jgi:hypothetical protein
VIVQVCFNKRHYATAELDLKDTMRKIIPAKRELLKKVKANGDKKLGELRVENALGGMRYGHLHNRWPTNINQRSKVHDLGRLCLGC